MKSGYKITPPRINSGANTKSGINPKRDKAWTGIIIPEKIVPTVCVLLLSKFPLLLSVLTNKYIYIPYKKNIVLVKEPDIAPTVSVSSTVSKTL